MFSNLHGNKYVCAHLDQATGVSGENDDRTTPLITTQINTATQIQVIMCLQPLKHDDSRRASRVVNRKLHERD